jgi:F-type H+-transporting ATPase subunit delta
MSENQIAERYAKSLLTMANEKGLLEAVYSDMQLIANTCKGSRELQLLLSSPIVKFDKKLSILKAIFLNKVNPMTAAFFELLTRKHREALLHHIALEFINEYNTLKGIVKAQIYTPFKLDAALRAEFNQVVESKTGKKVEMEEFVKEDLIGGYILRIGDLQIDNSVKTKLHTIKKSFSENHYIPKI